MQSQSAEKNINRRSNAFKDKITAYLSYKIYYFCRDWHKIKKTSNYKKITSAYKTNHNDIY